MTKIAAILALAALVLCCNKNDNDPTPAIVGKWEVTDASEYLLVNGAPYKDYLVSTGYSEADAQKAADALLDGLDVANEKTNTYQFQSDGRLWIISTDNNILKAIGAWEFSSDQKTLHLTETAFGVSIFRHATVKSFTDSDLQFETAIDSSNIDGLKKMFYLVSTLQKK